MHGAEGGGSVSVSFQFGVLCSIVNLLIGGAGAAEGGKGAEGGQPEGGAEGGGPEDHQGGHPEAHDEEQEGTQGARYNRLKSAQHLCLCMQQLQTANHVCFGFRTT